ncbi:MAG TPA: CAP domain-containing protein [Mycobacteriales bacterium]|nr:CAP domain-containing protein [Mycobacteriales bacterium]
MPTFRPALLRHALLVSAALSAPLLIPSGAPAPAETDVASTTPALSQFDSRLLSDMNRARASRGVRRLALVAGTTDVAHRWSCHMARYNILAHNPSLRWALETHGSIDWTTYGENVAEQPTGYGADHLFRSYMRDPAHRANILDRAYRYVGVWSKRGSGRRWNTTDFVGTPVDSYLFSYGATQVTC